MLFKPYAFQICQESLIWPLSQFTSEKREAGQCPWSICSCWLAVRGSQDSLVRITELAARACLSHLIMKIYGSGQTHYHPPQAHFSDGDPFSSPTLNQSEQIITPLDFNSCVPSFADIYIHWLFGDKITSRTYTNQTNSREDSMVDGHTDVFFFFWSHVVLRWEL